MVTRRFDVFDPVVLTVGTFHAGTTDNVIPDDAAFVATIRTFSAQTRDRLRDMSLRLVRKDASGHGLNAEASFVDAYPIPSNDQSEFAFSQLTICYLLVDAKFLT